MNLSNLSFYSQYIKSPVNFLHKIPTKYKIIISFSLLLYITYIYNIYKLNIIYYYISIVYMYFFYINKKMLHLIYKFLCITIYIYIYHKTDSFIVNQLINLYIPKKIEKLNYQICKKFIIIYYIYYIPIFIINIIIISIVYSLINKLLFLSTNYESINIFFVNFIKNFYFFNVNSIKNFTIILLLTTHFLERIVNNINIIYLAIIIKYSRFIKPCILFLVIYKLINKYINIMLLDIQDIVINLWNRKLLEIYFS